MPHPPQEPGLSPAFQAELAAYNQAADAQTAAAQAAEAAEQAAQAQELRDREDVIRDAGFVARLATYRGVAIDIDEVNDQEEAIRGWGLGVGGYVESHSSWEPGEWRTSEWERGSSTWYVPGSQQKYAVIRHRLVLATTGNMLWLGHINRTLRPPRKGWLAELTGSNDPPHETVAVTRPATAESLPVPATEVRKALLKFMVNHGLNRAES